MPEKNVGMLKPRKANVVAAWSKNEYCLSAESTPMGTATRMLNTNAEPEIISQNGRLGRSEGCFALPNRSHQEVMARLGPGHFLYADRSA